MKSFIEFVKEDFNTNEYNRLLGVIRTQAEFYLNYKKISKRVYKELINSITIIKNLLTKLQIINIDIKDNKNYKIIAKIIFLFPYENINEDKKHSLVIELNFNGDEFEFEKIIVYDITDRLSRSHHIKNNNLNSLQNFFNKFVLP